jgi:hypothetical protein
MAPAPLKPAAPLLTDRSAVARRLCLAPRPLVERDAPCRSNPLPPRRSLRGEAAAGERCLRVYFCVRQALPQERKWAQRGGSSWLTWVLSPVSG